MGKTENVFMLNSKDTRVGNSKSSVSNRLFSFSSEPETNFDITADWVSAGVTDQASFEAFLTGQGATSVTITYFNLTAGRLKAFIDVEGLTNLYLMEIGVSDVKKVSGFDSSFIQLGIVGHLMTSFNPIIPLPNSLEILDISEGQIEEFNPSILLPSNLITLALSVNPITEFNPTFPLPSNLQNLLVGQTLITYFNPSNELPTSLIFLDLKINLITTAGYTISETWATSQPAFTNTCTIDFSGNTNSVSGTLLQTILLTKNTSLIA
jgi:Leucine-rich repeat (LRR) protein